TRSAWSASGLPALSHRSRPRLSLQKARKLHALQTLARFIDPRIRREALWPFFGRREPHRHAVLCEESSAAECRCARPAADVRGDGANEVLIPNRFQIETNARENLRLANRIEASSPSPPSRRRGSAIEF